MSTSRSEGQSETHELIAPCEKLTSRAINWATYALARDDTTVSALARHLQVAWHTRCGARFEARRLNRRGVSGDQDPNFDDHRLRILRVTDAGRAYRNRPNHAQ